MLIYIFSRHRRLEHFWDIAFIYKIIKRNNRSIVVESVTLFVSNFMVSNFHDFLIVTLVLLQKQSKNMAV